MLTSPGWTQEDDVVFGGDEVQGSPDARGCRV